MTDRSHDAKCVAHTADCDCDDGCVACEAELDRTERQFEYVKSSKAKIKRLEATVARLWSLEQLYARLDEWHDDNDEVYHAGGWSPENQDCSSCFTISEFLESLSVSALSEERDGA